MSAPIRRPIASDTSSYLDAFDEFEHEHTKGNLSPRTLKPPPEIWELVHPVSEEQFKPAEALVSRLAKKNLFMVVVAILLTSGVSLAAWKFHIPQKVAAVFAEPDVPAKKSAPMTVRRTTDDATKAIQSAATMTNAAVIQPTAQEVNNDVAQPVTTVSKSAVRKSSKGGTRVASSAAAAATATTSITTTSGEPGAATKPKAQPGSGESSAVGSENKNAVNTTDTAAKSKPNSAASPQLVAPVKPTPAPKPKVIQWP